MLWWDQHLKEKFIITFKKKIIYKNVHMFIKKIKSYKIIIKKTLCKNLDSCLQKMTLF